MSTPANILQSVLQVMSDSTPADLESNLKTVLLESGLSEEVLDGLVSQLIDGGLSDVDAIAAAFEEAGGVGFDSGILDAPSENSLNLNLESGSDSDAWVSETDAFDRFAVNQLPPTEITALNEDQSGFKSKSDTVEIPPSEITVITGDVATPSLLKKTVSTEGTFLTVDGNEYPIVSGAEQGSGDTYGAASAGTGVSGAGIMGDASDSDDSGDSDPVNTVGRVSVSGEFNVLEGSSGHTTVITFVVERDNPISIGSVEWVVDADFLGLQWPDSQSKTGLIDFAPGQTQASVSIEISGDKSIEPNYDILFSLVNPGVNTVLAANSSITTTVLDDDGVVGISVDKQSIDEGQVGELTQLTYTVTRTNALDASSVEWFLEGVDSADLVEGQVQSGSVSFAANELSKTFTVTVKGDLSIEDSETLNVSLKNPGANLTLDSEAASVVSEIVNDDSVISISPVKNSVQEGADGEVDYISFIVTRSGSLSPSSIDWTASGIADEYLASGQVKFGSLDFEEGEFQKEIKIAVIGNDLVDRDRTLSVTLSNPDGNTIIVKPSASTKIVNDDAGFVVDLSVNVLSVKEGQNGDPTTVTFTVLRSSDYADRVMSVDYVLKPIGSSPVSLSDFVSGQDSLGNNAGLPSAKIDFEVGQTEAVVSIQVNGDSQIEVDENFTVVLQNPSDGVLASNGEVTGSIYNDDSVYDIALVSNLTQLEGNDANNTTQFVFEVTRSVYSGEPGVVDFVVNGIGENMADENDLLTSLSGTINFDTGETTKTIVFDVNADSVLEGYEAFSVSLVEDSGVNVGVKNAFGIIAPDDAGISIEPLNAIVKEGSDASALNSHVFVITRTNYTSSEVVVDWVVSPLGDNPVDADDFNGNSLPSGSVTFAAGETEKTIEIFPSYDLDYEENETYEVVVSSAQNGVVIVKGAAEGTILNDEVGVFVEDVSLNTYESTGVVGSHENSTVTFAVTRSGDINTPSTVDWEMVLGSVSVDDFVDGTVFSGSLDFAEGESAKLISFETKNDAVIETDETFTIHLSNASYGSQIVVNDLQGTVRNDDAQFVINASDDVYEGNGGTKYLEITVTREGDLSSVDTVDYVVTAGENNPVSADDFIGNAFPTGTLTFGVDSDSEIIYIPLNADSVIEDTESLVVTLSNASEDTAIFSATTSVGVKNDDDIVTLQANQVSKVEGADGVITLFTYVVSRSGDLSTTSQVAYAVAGSGSNPANAADFVGGAFPSGTVILEPNESSATIEIEVQGDYDLENDESFTLSLSNPTAGTTLDVSSVDNTIINDDIGISISGTTTNVVEGGVDQTTQHVFTVTRTGILDGSVEADWTLNGIGSNPANSDDFSVTAGSISFADGESTAAITINVVGDTEVEPNENFEIVLSNATNNTDILVDSVSSTIVADDIGIAVTSNQDRVDEGASLQTQAITFTVTRSGDLSVPVEIDWAATGMAVDDFVAGTLFNGGLNFQANEPTKTLTFTLKGDSTLESNETLTLTVSTADGNVGFDHTHILNESAITEVINDDSSFSIADAADVFEGTSETPTEFTFTITRDGNLSEAKDIDWKVTLPTEFAANINDFIAGQDLLNDNDGLPSGTVQFGVDEVSKDITIKVRADNAVENDDRFNIVLSTDEANVSFSDDLATTTILSDDTGFSIEAVNAFQVEGNAGETIFEFTVTRAGSISQGASVEYVVSGGSGNSALATDFVGSAFPTGILTFGIDETQKVIQVKVVGDTEVETDESFSITISNAKLADNTAQSIVDSTATAIIENDDQAFAVTTGAAVDEGNSGSKTITFTVSRSGDISEAATIEYAVTSANGGDANDISGDALPAGTLSFDAGQSTKTVTMDVLGDLVSENDENFTLTLSNNSAGTITTASATAVVNNDDTKADFIVI